MNNMRNLMKLVEFVEKDPNGSTDTISVDVPLMVRLLEFAREDAKTDMQLHVATENMLEIMKTHPVLTMEQYDAIVIQKDDAR